jgi:xanthine dehydrogenase accessory factor
VKGWGADLQEVLAAEGAAFVVTVAAARGSVPREPGARIVVGAATLRGTIGGGHLEFEAVRIARNALAESPGSAPWLVRFPLAARLGQCCGGVATLLFQRVDASDAWPGQFAQILARGSAVALVVGIGAGTPSLVTGDSVVGDVSPGDTAIAGARALLGTAGATPVLLTTSGCTWYIERVVPPDFHVVLFGNGHVARALVQVLSPLPCDVTWVDGREHDFPATIPGNTTVVATDAPEDAVRDASTGSYFLVMTHSHALDFDLIERILARGDFRYLGLIGSVSKRAQFERKLLARGAAAAALKRITCPIGIGAGGLPAIGSKEPGAIAIAVAAEILHHREGAFGAVRDRRAHA